MERTAEMGRTAGFGRTADLRLTALFLLGVAAIAWLVTADRMEGMDMGPGTDLGSFGWFAGVWAVMMAAMMLPSLVPMAGAYARRARGGAAVPTPQSLVGTTLFAAGYLLAWTLTGLVAWIIFELVSSLDLSFLAWDEGGRYVAGAVIAGAALYELTPMKKECLRHCRDRELLVADWRDGPRGALQMGLGQGAYCIGSSWALMAALFALGVMSITWMVVIAAAIAVEKLLPWRDPATWATAALLAVLATGVAFFPGELPGLTIPTEMESMGSMDSMGAMDSMDTKEPMDSMSMP
jgi:predicted metal-binding membrane protein